MLWTPRTNAPVTPPAETPEINHFIHAFLSVIVSRRPGESHPKALWEDRATTHDATGRRLSGRIDAYPQHMFYSARYTADEFTAELWNPTTCWNPVPFLRAHTMASSRKKRNNDLGFLSLNLQINGRRGRRCFWKSGCCSSFVPITQNCFYKLCKAGDKKFNLIHSNKCLNIPNKTLPLQDYVMSLKILVICSNAISKIHCKK